jgi:hypothetical protein
VTYDGPHDVDPSVAAEQAIGDEPDVLGVAVTTGVDLDVSDVQVVVGTEADLADVEERVRRRLTDLGAGAPPVTIVRSAQDDAASDATSRIVMEHVAVAATNRAMAAVVRLRAGRAQQTGTARGPLDTSAAELAAQATVATHRRLRGWPTLPDVTVSLEQVGGHSMVAVIVSSRAGRPLLGAALCDAIPLHLAAARATLDAFNRGPADPSRRHA